jgi:hypothetical protein
MACTHIDESLEAVSLDDAARGVTLSMDSREPMLGYPVANARRIAAHASPDLFE